MQLSLKKTLNPVHLSAKIITSLYNHFDSIQETPSVFSIGMISGGSAGNIVPDEVKLQGTFRAMDEKYRAEAHLKIREICNEQAKAMGSSCRGRH